jgi:hypothetical protein
MDFSAEDTPRALASSPNQSLLYILKAASSFLFSDWRHMQSLELAPGVAVQRRKSSQCGEQGEKERKNEVVWFYLWNQTIAFPLSVSQALFFYLTFFPRSSRPTLSSSF